MKQSNGSTVARRQARIAARQVLFSAFCVCVWFSVEAQTSYTSTSATGAWNTSRWNNSTDAAPYTSTFTANNAVNFTSGTYNFAGMGATINVGNVTVASGVTVNFATIGSTFATGGAVRTFNIGSGATFDFNGQQISVATGTGFIITGGGVFATGAWGATPSSGGFTLNSGTVIARGTTGMGTGTSNFLTLNGGTVASNGNRAFDNTRFAAGIFIGGNVQFGELATVVSIASSSANLSFANNVNLGGSNRILTQGNEGTNTFSGIISNTGSDGITFAANAGASGRFDITNAANTFTGNITVTGGEVRFTTDGSMGNAANDIYIDGGRFAKASDATTLTLGAGREIFIGDGPGTSISSPGSGTLIYNGSIADISGDTGSWAKQGGGTLELGGASTYTGDTAINNGTVRLTTGNNRLPTGTTISLGQAASANLGTLDLNGFGQQIAGLNSVIGNNADLLLNNIVTSASAAILTLGGAGTYSFGDGTNANSGVITGAIAIVKSGVGTQTFGEANTYTGGTTVSGGILRVTNTSDSATGSGSVVLTNSTILGTGRIAPASGGSITLDTGAIVSVGDAGDTMGKVLIFTPASGTLSTTFEADSTLEVDLFSGAGSGDNSSTSVAADIFRWGGSLTLDSGASLKVNNPNAMTSFAAGDIWRILDWTTLSGSGPTGTFTTLDLPTLDVSLDWDVSSLYTAGTIGIVYVPEPSRALLLIIGSTLLCFRRRR